ncbi:MAG TPA: DegV family protein [Patescibacteria group bacterium]|nr:DegV family protein [Patescibacteria group bacterium]
MAKSKVAIATDSTSYIPPDLVEQYNIHVIPEILNWEGETYLDDIDIKPTEFYRRLGTAKELPTTSQPSAGEFLEFFKKIGESSDSIVGIFISDELSGTLDSATTAKEMLPDFPIEIVDSRSASMGLGFMVLAAARAAEAGLSPVEIARLAREMVPIVKTIFVVDTLEYLHKGGRIGGAQRLIGSVLSIKPVLHLDDGRIEPLASIRTKRKAIERVLEIISEDVAGKGPMHAAVIHAAAPEAAAEFKVQVKQSLNPVELLVAELSPVVGTHTGPGLVGLGYYCDPV